MFGQSQKSVQLRHAPLSSPTNRSRFLFGDNDDSIDRARNIRFGRSGSFQDDGRVRSGDPDYYRFTLRNSGNVKFNFQNRGDDLVRFSIVDRRDRTISLDGRRLFTDLEGDDKQKFSARLSQGTYFIRIETPSRSNERYDFRLRLNSNRNDN